MARDMDSREKGKRSVATIRAPNAAALFNALDPAPLPGRELDPAVAGRISSQFSGGRGRFPRDARIVVHLDDPSDVRRLEDALHAAFDIEHCRSDDHFHTLMIEGRRTLVISVGFVLLCLAIILGIWGSPDEVPLLAGGTASVASWVVLWRPIEIFFYDWWPIRAEGRMWRLLGTAPVEVRHGPM